MNWIEIIGYSGSFLIALSLTMNNIWRLRWINLFGAGTFAIYGLLTSTYPVFALNSFITAIDVYYLVQMHRQKDYFTLSEVPKGSNLFLQRFLNFFNDDIRKFFPDFDWESIGDPHCVFILRNLLPVGLFIYEPLPNGVAKIHLDYARPEYRDLRNAFYLFKHQKERLHELGIQRFVIKSHVKEHLKYLHKMGFKPDPSDKTVLFKTI